MRTGGRHLRFIDALRGLMALYVVVHHGVYSVFDETQPGPSWVQWWVKALSNGHTAVVVFIVISGFCLAWPVAQQGGVMKASAMQFLTRRAKRILPPYWAALAFGALMGWTVVSTPMGTGREWDNAIPFDWRAIAMHALLLGDVYAPWTDKVNHPLWSVAVESKIYLSFPVMVVVLQRWGRGAVLSLVAVAAWVVWCVLSSGPVQAWAPWINLGPSGISPHFWWAFCCGVLAAYHCAAPSPTSTWPWWVLGLCWVGVLSAVAAQLPPEMEATTRFMLRDLSKAVLCSFLIVGLMRSNGHGRIDALWGVAPLARLGTLSYSLYLTHAPVIEWVMRLMGTYQGSVLNRLMVTGVVAPTVAIAVAGVFYVLIERPAHRWASARAPGR